MEHVEVNLHCNYFIDQLLFYIRSMAGNLSKVSRRGKCTKWVAGKDSLIFQIWLVDSGVDFHHLNKRRRCPIVTWLKSCTS